MSEESEAPGILPFRLIFRRGRRRQEEREERGRERPSATVHVNVSPLSFWRRSRARSYRREPTARHTWGRTWQRIRGMYFPPWIPVVAIIAIVFGILGFMFYSRETVGAPRIGDHWHASYQIYVCGERQPNAPEWRGGVHTHGDGVIHIHPQVPAEEGAGARLVKWFEYGGGKLTKSEMRIPGQAKTWKNGDECPDGSKGVLQVFVNGERLKDWTRYIPQDGDRIRIVFGPEEEKVGETDRTVIPESEATRTLELEVSDSGDPRSDTALSPTTLRLEAGETVKIVVRVSGSTSHGLRVAGPDGRYNTKDDYVSDPEIIPPGEEGVVVVRFDEPGEYEFQDSLFPDVTGTIVVEAAPGQSGQQGQ